MSTAELGNHLQRYLTLTDERKQLRAQLAPLDQEYRQVTQEIVAILHSMGRRGIKTNAGMTFVVHAVNKRSTITKAHIIKGLLNSGTVQDPEQAADIANYIYDERHVTVVEEIRRK